jgi:murein DD-endopeptidase MepM/ murein hydrolase activator NlpD
MRLVLVFRRGSTRVVELGDPRLRLCLGVFALVALGACAGSGAALALRMRRPAGIARETVALSERIDAQRERLAMIRRDARRDVNALGVSFARLQAEDARRTALGTRVAAGLDLDDDAELHFDEAAAGSGAASLGAATDALASRLFDEEEKLRVLESYLDARRMKIQSTPRGMPAEGYISSYFGPRTDPFTGRPGFHSGLDVAAPMGSPIHAVARGIVTYAGVRNGYGEVVEIDHGNGYVTRYAHASRLLVHAGQRVDTGAVIGRVGSTGRSTGAHVHFEVWHDGRVVNPLGFVQAKR